MSLQKLRAAVTEDLQHADEALRNGNEAQARKHASRAIQRLTGRARSGRAEDLLAAARESLADESRLRLALGTNHPVTRAKGRSTTALYNGALGRSEGRARAQRRDEAVLAAAEKSTFLKAVRRAAKRVHASSKKAWERTKATAGRL